MNANVRLGLAQVESRRGLEFMIYVRRPFITALIRDSGGSIYGVGTACVQLPDLWDVDLGTTIAKTRAVKDMLGVPNPRIKNVVAHEVSRIGALV